MMLNRPTLTLLAVLGPCLTTGAADAPSSRPADPCAQRAAATAFAELTARLLRLPMTERDTVGQWIGSRADVELALRRVAYDLRQVRVVSPPGAGTRRVEVSIAIAGMARGWARLLRQTSLVSVEELEQIRQWSIRAEQGRLSATGTAACPADASTRPATTGADSAPPIPLGWEHLPPSAVVLARRAAVADAAERMRARCRELHLGSGETLGDLFDLYGDFEDAFLEQMRQRLDAEPVYEPFVVCRLPARLSVKDITAVLSRVAAQMPRTAGLSRLDFSQLSDPAERGAISVEGTGIPPPPRLAWPGRSPANDAPTWATETLTATGQSDAFTDPTPAADASARRQAAVARARLDATRNMWLQVDELTLPGRRRARDVILAHPEIAADLAALEKRVTDVSDPEVDEQGRASVKIKMPLAPLWDVLSRAAAAGDSPTPATRPARRPASQPSSRP